MIMTDTINNDAATSGSRKASPFLMPGDIGYPDSCQEEKPIHQIVAYMIDDMECFAGWIRQKAEEYPEDETRNLDCAAEADEMAKRLSEYEGGPALDEYEAIYKDADGGYKLSELQREKAHSIYFTASDPEEYFRDLVESYNAQFARACVASVQMHDQSEAPHIGIAKSGDANCSETALDREVDSPNIAPISPIVEAGGRGFRQFFDRSEQEVQCAARQIALEFSDSPLFLEEVRKLFTTSEGVSANQLELCSWWFSSTSQLPYHRYIELLIAFEENLSQFIDPARLASLLRIIWQSNEAGFNLLPDPAKTPVEEYGFAAGGLLSELTNGDEFGPERLLSNAKYRDLDFWLSLPRKFTIYRGSFGISAENCAVGVCWTTKREIAEWFALRALRQRDPVLVSARIFKSQVSTVFAYAHEIAVQPDRFKQLKIRRRRCGRFPVGGCWNGEATDKVAELAQDVSPNTIQTDTV